MSTRARKRPPNWDDVFETAVAQDGLFTTAQAAAAGYSPQLLQKYLRARKVIRVRRGVYRIVHFPAGEHEELVAIWLWSERSGTFSHETALSLLGLSDALPSRFHIVLPADWSTRRLRVPRGVILHFADIKDEERTWVGPVPVTSPQRSIADCRAAHVSPEILDQAIAQATARGLIAATKNPKRRPGTRADRR